MKQYNMWTPDRGEKILNYLESETIGVHLPDKQDYQQFVEWLDIAGGKYINDYSFSHLDCWGAYKRETCLVFFKQGEEPIGWTFMDREFCVKTSIPIIDIEYIKRQRYLMKAKKGISPTFTIK